MTKITHSFRGERMAAPVRALLALVLASPLLFTPPEGVHAAAGDLDPTFSTGGRAVFDFADVSGKVLIQPDWKILISSGGTPVFLARLDQDGKLDTTFGDGGKVGKNINNFDARPSGVALLDDGRILVGGRSTSDSKVALMRFNSDGSPDATFGNAGRAEAELFATMRSQPPPSSCCFDEWATALVVQPDGKIIALAQGSWFFTSTGLTSIRTAMARFNSDGTLDQTFGTNGIVSATPFPSDLRGVPRKVLLLPGGKFMVCWIFPDILGRFSDPRAPQAVPLARYNADGTLDSTFSLDTFRSKSLSDIALQKDGKIVVTFIGGGFLVGRVNVDGTLDTSFGGTGIVAVDVDNNPDHPGIANALVIQADGKIVAAGKTGGNIDSSQLDEDDFALARLNPDGSLDTTFGNGGTVRTDFSTTRSGVPFTKEAVDSLALQADGRIVAYGTTGNGSFPNIPAWLALARYSGAGATPTVVQFGAPQSSVIEGCVAKAVTVRRSGDTTGTSTVDLMTVDGTARQKSDYTLATGTLTFAPGETSKDFSVLISDDQFAEGAESLTLALSNPAGAAIGAQGTAALQIADDDTVNATANPIDDPATFVGEHYHDFLNRQADDGGQAFWTNEVTKCGPNPQCVAARRVNVSAAFFLSIEFQQTGYLVIRIYKAGLGDQPANPRFVPFMRDTRQIGKGVVVGIGDWEQQLKNNRQQFAEEFVTRPEFRAAHDPQNADQYVSSLFSNAGVIPTLEERNAALGAFGTGDTAGRARALMSVVEGGSVYNKLYNEVFVLMQYFGYLRRNPDGPPDNSYAGYNFWLAKLNSFTRPGEDVRDEAVAFARVQRAEMVRAFIESSEYRGRSGLR